MEAVGLMAGVADAAAALILRCNRIEELLSPAFADLKQPVESLHRTLTSIHDIYASEKADQLVALKGDEKLSLLRQELVNATHQASSALDLIISQMSESPNDVELLQLFRDVAHGVNRLFLPGTSEFEQRETQRREYAEQVCALEALKRRHARSLKIHSGLGIAIACLSIVRIRYLTGQPLFGIDPFPARHAPADTFSDPHIVVTTITLVNGFILLLQSRWLAGDKEQLRFLMSGLSFGYLDGKYHDANTVAMVLGFMSFWTLLMQIVCWVGNSVVRRKYKRQAKEAMAAAASQTSASQV